MLLTVAVLALHMKLQVGKSLERPAAREPGSFVRLCFSVLFVKFPHWPMTI